MIGRLLGLLAISLGVALIIVDLAIVNVVLPPIIADLSLTSVQAQWVQESYAVVFVGPLLISGRLADLWARGGSSSSAWSSSASPAWR